MDNINDNEIGYINEVDNMGLVKSFNKHMKMIHDNLVLFFNQDLTNDIYPEIYNNLVYALYSYIDLGYDLKKFNICFDYAADEIINNAFVGRKVDIFSSDYLLSKCNFNDFSKSLIVNNIQFIILGTCNKKLMKENIDYNCMIYGISKLKLKSEFNKVLRELSKVSKDEDKELKIKK